MADSLVRVDRVTKSYGERVLTHVLHGIDLEIRAGEFVALTGPSGSGKSTLLNLIGLLDRPSGGEVDLEGRSTALLDDRARTRLRARKLGFIFQFHHLLPAFTAVENVEMPLLADRGRRDPEMRQRATALLFAAAFFLRLSFPRSVFSVCAQRRFSIWRARLSPSSSVPTPDPTGTHAAESGEQVLRLLRRFNETRSTA